MTSSDVPARSTLACSGEHRISINAVTGSLVAAAPDFGYVVPPQLLNKGLRQHHRPR